MIQHQRTATIDLVETKLINGMEVLLLAILLEVIDVGILVNLRDPSLYIVIVVVCKTMSVCISYLNGGSLTKNAIGDFAITACATCLLTVPVQGYRSTNSRLENLTYASRLFGIS
jgi:hypothetical protein